MRRLLVTIIICCGITLGLGLICKNSYTDKGICEIQTIEDVQKLNCNVNQIFTKDDVELFISDMDNKAEALEKGDIYIVQSLNSLEQNNFTMTQSVGVVEVIQGDAVVGEQINIVTSGGVYDQKYKYHDYENDSPIYYGLMNLLYPENLYLVFLAPLETNIYTEEKYYYYTSSILCAFNLTSDESAIVEKDISQICYNDFGAGEFLCDSEYTLDYLLKYKRKIVQKYNV